MQVAELKQQIRVLQAVGFGAVEGEEAGAVGSLEVKLLGKLRGLEHALTTARLQEAQSAGAVPSNRTGPGSNVSPAREARPSVPEGALYDGMLRVSTGAEVQPCLLAEGVLQVARSDRPQRVLCSDLPEPGHASHRFTTTWQSHT